MSSIEPRSRWRGLWSVGNVCVPRAFGIAGPVVVVAVLLLAGCSSESESPDVPSYTGLAPASSPTVAAEAPTPEPTATVAAGAPATATEAPAATATTAPVATEATARPTARPVPAEATARPTARPVPAEATPMPKLSPLPPASEVTYDRQKELLSALVQEWFVGVNNLDRPRLKLLPDVRDNRRGGILIHIEINGDEYDTTTKKKAELDILMRDTYELIYTTGYEVTEVAITAVMNGVRHITAKSASIEPIQAFRSRLRGDAAATVDWANKDSLDFNEIWDNVLLNTAWKRELAEEAEAGP